MPMKSTTETLQSNIRAAYARDGFYIAEKLLSDEECDQLKIEALRVMAEHAAPGGTVCVGVAAISPAYRLLADDPRLVTILQALLPDGVMFMSDKIVFKSAAKAFASPWHIDAAYWPGTRPKLSVWIPLDDATAENGTLVAVRGSHGREWRHVRSDGRESNGEFGNFIRERLWPAEDELVCAIPRGSAVFFGDRLVHGSRPNTAGKDRYTLIGTYQAPEPAEAFDLEFPARHVIIAPPTEPP